MQPATRLSQSPIPAKAEPIPAKLNEREGGIPTGSQIVQMRLKWGETWDIALLSVEALAF
jgi:hypothetical protein